MARQTTRAQRQAARAAQGAAQERQKAARRSVFMTRFWLTFTLVLLAAVALPTVLVLTLGMMPSLVAYVIDRTPQKYATFCVGSMNFCGVFPYLIKLWQGTQTVRSALDILTDVFALFVMYGAAGFGWMVFMAVPPVIVAVLMVMAQRRLAVLRAQQRRIIEEWGEEVASATDGKDKKAAAAAPAPASASSVAR